MGPRAAFGAAAMTFLDRIFRRRARTVSEVRGVTRVELDCEIGLCPIVVSPVSGARAALIRWTLLEQQTFHGGRTGGGGTRHRVLARGLYGEPRLLLVQSAETIEVPLERASLVLVEDSAEGELLQRMPEALVPAVREARANGPIAYRESHLRSGDRVRLTATLERLRTEAGVGYRDAGVPGPMLRAIADERIVVRDRLA